MAATAEAPTLRVSWLAKLPDGTLCYRGLDGQNLRINANVHFDVLRDEADIDIRNCLLGVFDNLRRLHRGTGPTGKESPNPALTVEERIKRYVFSALVEQRHLTVFDVRNHFELKIGEDLEFEQTLTYTWQDIKVALFERP